jgi:pimeloyl-ACP methyl ester carboxylesterase
VDAPKASIDISPAMILSSAARATGYQGSVVDRLVEDVESLRVHLGLDQMDLLAHSAGAVLATLYAAAYPQHLSRLILVTPGLAAVRAPDG